MLSIENPTHPASRSVFVLEADEKAPIRDKINRTQPINLQDFENTEFDRGASRVKELIWLVVKSFFFQFHFPMPSGLRRFLLRLFGARIGVGVIIRSGVNVTYPWRLKIGDYSWIGEDVFILSLAPVNIGSHTCISQRAFLCTGSHDFTKSTFDLVTRPITINSQSWIAANAFIGPGVEVPARSMVSAGQIVSSKTFRDSHADSEPAT